MTEFRPVDLGDINWRDDSHDVLKALCRHLDVRLERQAVMLGYEYRTQGQALSERLFLAEAVAHAVDRYWGSWSDEDNAALSLALEAWRKQRAAP